MQRALDWIKRHRGVVAAIVAVWVVLKAGRWIAGGAWALREWIPWGTVGPWIGDHWVVAALAAAGLFVVTFVAVRTLIGVLARREARKRVPAPAGDQDAAASLTGR